MSVRREGGATRTSQDARRLGPEDAAVFETLVAPRYLSMFVEPALAMLAGGEDARVCHLQCRTGYPDRALLERLPGAHVFGCDASEHAIDLARVKAAALARKNPGTAFDYRVVPGNLLPFPDGAFSHALTFHPLVAHDARRDLLSELARLVAPAGQVLVALPLRGSFVEVADLLREYALKHERSAVSDALDAAAQLRPTEESLARELEAAGFSFVEVAARTRTLLFKNGRGFFEDPVVRLLVRAEIELDLGASAGPEPFVYVREAIDKYWSDGDFELTVQVGVVTGRRRV